MPNNSMIIPPSNIRDYARAKGWVLIPEAIPDRLYVLQNPRLNHGQLAFPMDTTAPDYDESVRLVVEKLASFEGYSLESILSSLLAVRDDTLRLRITSGHEGIESIPLAFATTAISATQQLLLSAAHTVLRPQVHHPRLNRAEAQQFLDAAQFGHTEHASFVLKVSCRIDALDIHVDEDEDVPFVRRAMLTVNRGIRQLVTAIEADRLAEFIEETRRDEEPLVSANFCEALTHLHDEALHNSLDISLSWAAVRPLANIEAEQQPVRIQNDQFAQIEDVRRALRSTADHIEDTFMATVEQLNGDVGDDGRRAGEVILNLFRPQGEVIRARTNLTADQYKRADVAHMHDGVFVRINGRLQPGRQPRQLTNITEFSLVRPRQSQIEE
jgi:hypothetical protein